MKKIIKSVIFTIIFVILWRFVFDILWLPKNSITSFYKEPKNSLDIVYIGASNVSSGFNSVLAYNLYGFTTGILAEGGQPFATVKYLIKESQKRQNPNLYIIDLFMLTQEADALNKGDFRSTIDSIPFSKNRFDTINETLSYTNIEKKDYINYYFSFLLYHNRWKNINIANFYRRQIYKGYWYYQLSDSQSQEPYIWKNEIIKLSNKNENILRNLINYIKQQNLNVLFVIPKRGYWSPGQEQLNDAVSIIKEENFDIINFNNIDDDIDFTTDFYDYDHFNIYGSTKYTLYFSKYLDEHYNLLNHKNENNYSSWQKIYEIFEQDFQNETGITIQEYIKDYYNNIN